MNSILDSIKKLLGIDADYTHFDPDIIMHINAAFLVLNQIGVMPEKYFSITGSTEEWTDFYGDEKSLEVIKQYIYLHVRRAFDPPTTSFVLESLNKQISELEWRINALVDFKEGHKDE